MLIFNNVKLRIFDDRRYILYISYFYNMNSTLDRLTTNHKRQSLINPLICTSILLVVIGLISCQSEVQPTPLAYELPDAIHGQTAQAFIESPVGTFQRLAYNLESGKMDTLFETNLPLPVNHGFLLLETANELRKISTWIIGKRMQVGDTVTVEPIALLRYEMDAIDHEDIVAVPRASKLGTVEVSKFRDLLIKYDPVKFNFEYWLRQHQSPSKLTQLSWQDEEKALAHLSDLMSD